MCIIFLRIFNVFEDFLAMKLEMSKEHLSITRIFSIDLKIQIEGPASFRLLSPRKFSLETVSVVPQTKKRKVYKQLFEVERIIEYIMSGSIL